MPALIVMGICTYTIITPAWNAPSFISSGRCCFRILISKCCTFILVQGAFDYMTAKGLNPVPKPFAVCIDGVIPPAAGVSSSSAFVVASGLATLRLHGVDLAKKELAAMCTTCEYASVCCS